MARYLVVVGGTWETRWGVLGAIALHPDVRPDWTTRWVEYPASYGTPKSVTDSVDRGAAALIASLRGLPSGYERSDIAVLGFSQGAMVVEAALREMRATGLVVNAEILARIRYVGLCGNPYRAAGDQVGPDPGGFGIVGPLQPPGVVPIAQSGAWENFALPGDLISSCPPDSLLRLIYPFTEHMSPISPDRWARDVLGKLHLMWLWRHLPELRALTDLPRVVARMHRDIDAAYQYQTTGIHGQYGTRKVAGQTPAEHIIRALREVASS